MGQLTIKQVMPTGDTHEKYGKEYHIQFAEVDTPVKKWSTKELAAGDILYGEVKDGKFVKDEYKPTPGFKAGERKRENEARTDGMRQGMCMNNAANYVAQMFPDLKEKEWAKKVWGYANALYSLGDLDGFDESMTADETAGMINSIEEVMGPVEKV